MCDDHPDLNALMISFQYLLMFIYRGEQTQIIRYTTFSIFYTQNTIYPHFILSTHLIDFCEHRDRQGYQTTLKNLSITVGSRFMIQRPQIYWSMQMPQSPTFLPHFIMGAYWSIVIMENHAPQQSLHSSLCAKPVCPWIAPCDY